MAPENVDASMDAGSRSAASPRQRGWSIDRARIAQWASRVILISSPALTLVLLSLISGHDCFSGLPLWSDEIDYWREMLSFVEAEDHAFGFYGFLGYPADMGEWGCHGIAPLIVYGLPGMAFGWHPASIVIVNMVCCMLSFAVLIALVRPSVRCSALIVLLWLLYPPIFSYAPTSMMEMPQYAGVIIFTGLLLRYVEKHERTIACVLFAWVFLFAGIRVSNIVFFIPVVLFVGRFKIGRALFGAALAALLLSVAAWEVFGAFNAGYPGGFMASLSQEGSLAKKGMMLLANVKGNLVNWLSLDEGIKQASQRYAYIAVMVLLFIGLIVARARPKAMDVDPSHATLARECLASLLVLFVALGIVVCAYDVFDWRDYRTLAPVLWSQLLFFAFRREQVVLVSLGGILCALLLASLPTLSATAAFEDARYAAIPEAPSGFPLHEVESEGRDPRELTLVLMTTEPAWLAYAMDPSLGYVGCTESGSGALEEMGYAYAPKGMELPDGFEVLWESDDAVLYAQGRHDD